MLCCERFLALPCNYLRPASAPLNLQRNKRSFLGHALMQKKRASAAVIEFYIK